MWPRNLKLLLMLAPMSALLLTACPDGRKRNDPSTAFSFAGVWVNADLYGAYRDLYKTDRGEFCRVVAREPSRFGIEESYGNQQVLVDSWVINSRGEVLVYNPRYRIQDTGYRETYWKGSVDQNGYYRLRTGSGFQTASYGQQFQNTRYYFYHASDARIFMTNTSSMKVWAGNNSREYIRTEDRPGNQEMANIYMATVGCFSSNVSEKPGYPDVGGEGPQGAYPPRPNDRRVVEERHRVMRSRTITPAAPPCVGGGCGAAPLPGGAVTGPPPPPMDGMPGDQEPPFPPGENLPPK